MQEVFELTQVFCGWLFSPGVCVPAAPGRGGLVLGAVLTEHGRPEPGGASSRCSGSDEGWTETGEVACPGSLWSPWYDESFARFCS